MTPAPSPMTKPSRSLSNGREACLRIIVARAHGAHRAKTADANGHNRRFRAAGEHDLRIAHLDRAPGFADGVVGGRARGAGGEIRPAQVVIHREQAGGHVADEHRDHERREPARPAFEQDLVLFDGRLQAADAGAEDDADFVAVFLVEIQAGIQQRLISGVNAELRVAVGAPDFLGRRKRGRRDRNSFTWPAICVSNGVASNAVILSMPHWPAIRLFQKTSS